MKKLFYGIYPDQASICARSQRFFYSLTPPSNTRPQTQCQPLYGVGQMDGNTSSRVQDVDSANLRLAEADKRASKEGNFYEASDAMAKFVTMLLVLAALASLSILSSSGNEDLATAIEEMRLAG